MRRDPDTAVLIVGAGPTGLTLAGELLRHGIPCRIVDRSSGPVTTSRAVAVQPRTLELLDPLGVSARLVSEGVHARQGFVFADGEPLVHLDFDGLDSAYPYMLLVPQPDTERALLAALAGWGVAPERETTLVGLAQDDDGVTATLRDADARERTVRSTWLVGCDGAHSAVRHLMGATFVGHAFATPFLLADVCLEWHRPHDAVHAVTVNGELLGIFPLPGGRARIVATERGPAERPEPTLAEVQAIVDARSPFPARLSDPRWTARFGVSSRIVDRMMRGRVFLAGDAAHIHSPAGGQGMNTGIGDAVNLAWKLALVARGTADAALLDSYDEERHPVDRGVIRSTDLLLAMMAARGGVRAFLRDHVVRSLATSRRLRRRVRRILTQIAVSYRGSPIVVEHALHGGPRAGDRAPDAWGTTPENTLQRVVRLGDGVRHTLVVMYAPCTPREDAAAGLVRGHDAWLAAATLADPAPDTVPSGWPHSLGQVYGHERPCVYVIRPDGYVGMRAPLARAAEALERYAAALRRIA